MNFPCAGNAWSGCLQHSEGQVRLEHWVLGPGRKRFEDRGPREVAKVNTASLQRLYVNWQAKAAEEHVDTRVLCCRSPDEFVAGRFGHSFLVRVCLHLAYMCHLSPKPQNPDGRSVRAPKGQESKPTLQDSDLITQSGTQGRLSLVGV